MHILTNTKPTLAVVLDAGEADGAVTATVVDAAGNQLATGAATVDDTVDGRYTFGGLAPQTAVKALTTTWAGTWGAVAQSFESYDEIVATQLFTLAQLRDFGDLKLASTDKFSDELLAAKRDTMTEDFEQICSVGFTRRYARDVLGGENRRNLYLMRRRPRKLLAVTVNGQALADDDVASITLYDSGKIERLTPWPYNPTNGRNIVVEYEYGYPAPPRQIVEAAKVLARNDLVATDIGDRTVMVSNDLGTVRLAVPGANYPTGIPIVDAALERYDESSPVEPF